MKSFMKSLVLYLLVFITIHSALYQPSAGTALKPVLPQTDERAHQVLERALQAFGGLDRLKAMTSIMMKANGLEHGSAEAQAYKPGVQSSAYYEETIVVWPSQERLAFEHRTGRGDKTVRWRRWLYTSNERTVGDFLVRLVYPRRNVSTATERARLSRRIPHLLIMEASRNPANLRLLSSSTIYGGKRQDVLSYSPPNEKVTLKLFFDSQTHLLSKCEYEMDFPVLGDVVVEHTYSSYRKDQSLGWIPTRQDIRVAGKVSQEVKNVEMAANTTQAEEMFQPPKFQPGEAGENFQLPENLRSLAGSPRTVVEAAKGINVVDVGGFTLMFIEFKDFILAVEAPAAHPSLTSIPGDNQTGSTSLSEAFIRKIKEKSPDKPIKYLVVTHSHSDHAGGVRAFMAEGATILTTHGNRLFFKKMASASYKLVPDRFSRSQRAARIETFRRKRVISDGERTVELINIGPNPHTGESIIVYIPDEKILFQGDLFYFDIGNPFPPKNRITIMSFFVKWLKDNRLAPERIYNVHGWGFATPEHVQQFLKQSGNQ